MEGKSKSSDMTLDEKTEELNSILTKIKNERDDFYNIVSFLPKYDKTKYLNRYEELLEKATQLKSRLFPKKKFAFSQANSNTNANASVLTQPKQSEKEEVKGSNTSDQTDLIIKNKENERIVLSLDEIKGKNNVIIENVKKCEIILLTNFKACYMKNIEESKIIIGSVSGGSHLTQCQQSQIFLATHQLRIHQTTSTSFYVMINSNPIIEHSTNNCFYPLKIKYDLYEKNISKAKIDINNNKWDQIQDFQWLKKDKSPNFQTLDNNTELLI